MATENYQNYHIAVKAFIRNGDKLLICKDAFFDSELFAEWDMPGGRINKEERETGFNEVLDREIIEEVGDIKYKNNGPAVIFRHSRTEQRLPDKPMINILMIGFDIEYLGGDVKISNEHTEYRWLPIEELKNAEKYFKGGWIDGIKKYLDYLESGKSKLVY